jgi:hypothetical protein
MFLQMKDYHPLLQHIHGVDLTASAADSSENISPTEKAALAP